MHFSSFCFPESIILQPRLFQNATYVIPCIMHDAYGVTSCYGGHCSGRTPTTRTHLWTKASCSMSGRYVGFEECPLLVPLLVLAFGSAVSVHVMPTYLMAVLTLLLFAIAAMVYDSNPSTVLYRTCSVTRACARLLLSRHQS